MKPTEEDIEGIKQYLLEGDVCGLINFMKKRKKDPPAIIYTMQKEIVENPKTPIKSLKSRMTALLAIYYLTLPN
jgi:hypothetical protein